MSAIANAVSSAVPEPVGEYPKTGDSESFAVFDALSDIVCITGIDGTLRFLNRAGSDLLGYVDGDAALVGCLFPTHTPVARELLLDEVIPAALRRGSATCDTALQTTDGRVFPASQTVIVTRDGNGQPVSLTIVIRNVSIERHAAARLGESQHLFEMIARTSPDLMYLYDPIDRRIVWTNRCPNAFLGGAERDARTLSRRELRRLVHPDDRAQFRATGVRMAAAYSDSEVLTHEMRVRADGGNWRWVHARASVFSRRETGAPLLLVGIVTDISVRKKAELQLVADRDAANDASHVTNEFLAHISAEFRATLHTIIGIATDVHADRDRRLTARELEQLRDMIVGSTLLLSTVADLHDLTRIESGEMPVQQAVIDARDVIRAAATAFADHPGSIRTPLVLDLPDAAAPVLTDPARLRQVLTQLIANALACTTDGRVTVALRVDAATMQPLSIDVHDAEVGRDTALADMAFAPCVSRQLAASSSIQSQRGSGLGLALARAMCEMVGCALSVAAIGAGAGSAFRITLPVSSRAALLAAEFRMSSAGESAGNAAPGSNVISSV